MHMCVYTLNACINGFLKCEIMSVREIYHRSREKPLFTLQRLGIVNISLQVPDDPAICQQTFIQMLIFFRQMFFF